MNVVSHYTTYTTTTRTIFVTLKVSIVFVRFIFSYLLSNRIGVFVWKSSCSRNIDCGSKQIGNSFSRVSLKVHSTKYFLIPDSFALKTWAPAMHPNRIGRETNANSTAVENNPLKRSRRGTANTPVRCWSTRKWPSFEARQRRLWADPNVGRYRSRAVAIIVNSLP